MNPATYITLSTIRLSCSSEAASSVGTGFIFDLSLDDENDPNSRSKPFIFTNKHVVRDGDRISIRLSFCNRDTEIGDNLSLINMRHEDFIVDGFQRHVIAHPDNDIDLCAISLIDLLAGQEIPNGMKIAHQYLHDNFFLKGEEKNSICPIEPVLMIGYPNGLWDAVNNRPIARGGYTATHPFTSCDNQRYFIVDIGCYPGSSGSPIFQFFNGLIRNGDGSYTPGVRARLLGVLFAGPTINNQGELVPTPIPTRSDYTPVIQNMMHLGYVLHADTILDIQEIARNRGLL